MSIQHTVVFRLDHEAAYDAYNTHPEHVLFTTTRWQSEVAGFQEYDFETL
jgi:Stress responsive A/B Barrel Domain